MRPDFLNRNGKLLGILVCCAVLLVLSRSDSALSLLARIPAPFSLPFLVLLFAVFIPLRRIALALIPAVALLVVTYALNALKVAALGLPIMYLDLKMIAADPGVIINAVGASATVVRAVAALVLLLLALAVAAAVFLHRRTPEAQRSSLLLSASCVAVVLLAGWFAMVGYGRYVHSNIATLRPAMWEALWLPETQARLARKSGVPEYIAFTAFAGRADYAPAVGDAAGPSAQEVRRAADRLWGPSELPRPHVLPNVVFFHAESTFDPNAALLLSAAVELPIWSGVAESQLLGPLRVNVLGGGSWVSEFEVVTGVDSRIFGYQGFYTHYYLAPSVRYTFAHYLARRGYRTAVFYSAERSFYRADRAFAEYGFDDFFDSLDLGMPADWKSLRDSTIVRAVRDRGAFLEPGPFFYFISSAENHGPHPCVDAPIVVTFARPASRAETCQLNEYIKRARSTSAAFELILHELQKIEAATGRPFVLLAYGDHQPWSFTNGRFAVAGGTAGYASTETFSNVRTGADGYQTFYHVASSVKTAGAPRIAQLAPVWLLPTMASFFVAASVDDMYLPENLHAFIECGWDILGSACNASAGIVQVMRASLFSAVNGAAEHAIGSYESDD